MIYCAYNKIIIEMIPPACNDVKLNNINFTQKRLIPKFINLEISLFYTLIYIDYPYICIKRGTAAHPELQGHSRRG
ncbi:hypothetical protein D3C71_856600 [compost metagenome]